jgi:hypothetical protein
VVEVHEGVRGPQPLPQFFSRHHLTAPLKQDHQELEGLAV